MQRATTSRRAGRRRLALVTLLLSLVPGLTRSADEVAPELASKIILKVLLLDERTPQRAKNGVVAGVVGSDAAYEAFVRLKGKRIDQHSKLVLADVVKYDQLDDAARVPTFVFIGAYADLEGALAFTRARKVLSATNVGHLVERGVTVGLAVEDKRPQVLLNLESSAQEGLRWSSRILRIARTVRGRKP